MVVYSKGGRHLKLVDARGVVKTFLDGKRYLVIVKKDYFNINSNETLLVEDQIECSGVKEYSRPRFFGRKQLIDTRYQVGRSIKLGISWDGSTRYLDIHPLTRGGVNRLGSLQLTCGEPYSPYSTFGISTSLFQLDYICLGTGIVKMIWKNNKIQ